MPGRELLPARSERFSYCRIAEGGGALAGREFLGRRQVLPDNGLREPIDYRMYP
jgi:hypothetical protein